MKSKQFTWLGATCYPRRGPVLEKGKAYNVADFDENVVVYWVEQKAAKFIPEKKSGGGE